MRIPNEILDKAFEIGFNYKKESSWKKASVSVPCCVTLKNGEEYQQAELLLTEKLFNEDKHTFFQIEDIESIAESEYALCYEFRSNSLKTPEYRNDFPFFLETKNGQLLGYNAIGPVNFTYRKDVKGSDIIKVVDFNEAQTRKFEFIKDNDKISIKILCGYNEELIEKIKTVYNKS